MTTHYTDGINHLHLQDGTVRGTLVVFKSSFEPSEKDPTTSIRTTTVEPVMTLMTSIRGALQMHAALDQLIKKLVENKVLQTTQNASAEVTPEFSEEDKQLLN